VYNNPTREMLSCKNTDKTIQTKKLSPSVVQPAHRRISKWLTTTLSGVGRARHVSVINVVLRLWMYQQINILCLPINVNNILMIDRMIDRSVL